MIKTRTEPSSVSWKMPKYFSLKTEVKFVDVCMD